MKFQKKPWYNDPQSKKFSHHQLFGTATSFPPTLGRILRTREDQKNTSRCTGYASAVAGGYIHNRRFHPDWQAAKIGQIQGYSEDTGGGDPNAVMKSQRDFGYVPYEAIPTQLSLEKNTVENTGWKAYSDVYDISAQDYHVAGWVKVDGILDTYGNIKSALLQASNTSTPAPVQAFGRWYNEWTYVTDGIIRNGYKKFVGYHDWLFVDWKTINSIEYLVAHNSWGDYVGDQGFFYFPRDIVNREFTLSGTTLKIVKPLTLEQIVLAKQESLYGMIQRYIISVWYILSNLGL